MNMQFRNEVMMGLFSDTFIARIIKAAYERWTLKGRAKKMLLEAYKDADIGGLATSEAIIQLLGPKCPWCSLKYENHYYAMLTARRLGDQNREILTEELLNKLRKEDWIACQSLFELAIDSDSLDAFIVACPNGTIGWFVRFQPYNYVLPSSLVDLEVVSDQGRERLKGILLNWKPLVGETDTSASS